MSGPWSARPPWWDIGRAGLGARVAGADVALAGLNLADARAGLVLEPVSWGTVALDLEPPGRPDPDRLNRPCRGALGPAPGRFVGTQAVLGHLS